MSIFLVTPFLQTIKSHKSGSACTKCVNENKTKKIEKFIEESNNIHGSIYDYSESIYINAHTELIIICDMHGAFKQTPNKHLLEHGCSCCGGSVKKTHREFLIEAKDIHGSKYIYIDEYKDALTKMIIMCPKHGVFKQTPNKHLGGQGCKKCNDENIKLDVNTILNRAYEIHIDKYIYCLSNSDYSNINSKIHIKCKKHKVFEQSIYSHLNGSGCPLCNASKGESMIEQVLNNRDIIYIRQYTFNDCLNKRALLFDFYLSDFNICIEYDGKQHFEPIEYFGGEEAFNKRIIRDEIKNNYCKDNNIKLLRIPYWDFDNIEEIIKNEI